MGEESYPFSEPRSFPEAERAFTDPEAQQLIRQYNRDPVNLSCPHCGEPNTMEVLAFIIPEVDADGYVQTCQPEGDYAAAVYCHGCKSAIGLRVGAFR